jgi:uncharacterized protein YecT (DUF1311 family)
MPQVNLTDATGQELRQLLDSSRRRGDAALSYRILQEMAVRRDAPAERRRAKPRRPAEPRHFVMEVAEDSEAPEADDVPPMPAWRPPALVAAAAAPPPEAPPAPARPRSRRKARPERAMAMAAAPAPSVAANEEVSTSAHLEDDRPLSLHDFDPEPFDDAAHGAAHANLRFQPIELGVPKAPPRSRLRLLAVAALGAVFGIAVGWLGGWLARDGMTRPAAPAPIQTAALAPQPAPAPPPAAPIAQEPTPQTPLDASAAPAPETVPTPPPSPKAPEAAPIPDGVAMELPASGTDEADAQAAKPAAKAAAKVRPGHDLALAPAAPALAKGCATQPTPADRVICGDAKLKRLQGDLRRAYDAALQAHEDRALLREHQLAWRDERSTVTDPDRLARLYEQRIRKLNAATAEAQRLR